VKYIFAALLLLSVFPLTHILRTMPRYRPYAWFALGALPLVAIKSDVALISWAMWPGHTRGMIVSLVDVLAIAILLTHRRVKGPPPFLLVTGFYLFAVTFSIAFAETRMAAFFYAWQFGRAILLMWAVTRIMDDPRAQTMIYNGVAVGAIFQALSSVVDRAGGALQAAGSFSHQNLLGMVMHFALYPLLAILLSGQRSRLTMAGVAAAMVAVALSGSRATVGLAGAGIVATILLSLMRRSTAKKMKMVGIGVVALAIISPLAIATLKERLMREDSVAASDYDERAAFEKSARMMWSDHPMGVGANEYVIHANRDGYSDRAGVVPTLGSRSAHVHNAYLLAGAETGYLGFVAFILMLAVPFLTLLRQCFRNRKDPRGDIFVGVTVTLGIVMVHCLFEWIVVMSVVQYMYAIDLGVAGGLMMVMRRERRQRMRAAQSAATGAQRPASRPLAQG
jgi:O-antigen ligase